MTRMVWGSLSGCWGGVERRVEELLALSTKRAARKMFELNEWYRTVLRCKDFRAAGRPYAARLTNEGYILPARRLHQIGGAVPERDADLRQAGGRRKGQPDRPPVLDV